MVCERVRGDTRKRSGMRVAQDRFPIAPSIAAEAADWIVRQDGGPLGAEETARLAAWRAADPRHEAALRRLSGLWDRCDALAAVPPLPLPVAARPRGRAAMPGLARRPGRLAAGVAVAACLVLTMAGPLETMLTRLRADYTTGAGERRSVRLPDGSTAMLDSGSAIALEYRADRRVVRLLAGEAAFQVTPDPQRPFTVAAAGGTSTARGTAFLVRREGGGAEVTVTEHRVEVAAEQGPARIVPEGWEVSYGGDGRVGVPRRVDVAAATGWMRGKLIVEDRPLAEVVGELARHHAGYLGVSGAAGRMRVSGVYDLDRPLAAVAVLQSSLGLRSMRVTDRFILLYRPKKI